MSLESLAIALHHSRSKGTAKVVLIGIANHDGDGGAWPSVSTLARYANSDRRTVQRAVEQLESLREIRRVVQGGGDHRFADHERPNRYEFLLQCPADCDRTNKHRTAHYKPVELDIDRAAPTPPPDAHAARGAAPTPPKPSLNSPKTKTSEKRHVPATRANGRCGHALVDDRHCTHGCPVKENAA